MKLCNESTRVRDVLAGVCTINTVLYATPVENSLLDCEAAKKGVRYAHAATGFVQPSKIYRVDHHPTRAHSSSASLCALHRTTSSGGSSSIAILQVYRYFAQGGQGEETDT